MDVGEVVTGIGVDGYMQAVMKVTGVSALPDPINDY